MARMISCQGRLGDFFFVCACPCRPPSGLAGLPRRRLPFAMGGWPGVPARAAAHRGGIARRSAESSTSFHFVRNTKTKSEGFCHSHFFSLFSVPHSCPLCRSLSLLSRARHPHTCAMACTRTMFVVALAMLAGTASSVDRKIIGKAWGGEHCRAVAFLAVSLSPSFSAPVALTFLALKLSHSPHLHLLVRLAD